MSNVAPEVPQKSTDVDERLVYVVPRDALGREADEISLLDLWNILWEGKWLGIAITAVVTLAAVIYSLLATEIYRAEMLLAPAEERTAQGLSGQLGGLSGLASLAGISVGGGGNAEPLAVLQSRAFLREFIEARGLMPILFSDQWDEERGRWLVAEGDESPDIRDGVKLLQESVLSVSEETGTGLVSLSIDWTDPDTAADWANDLVARLNDRMRQRALVDAEQNVTYLQEQLAASSLVTLQQSIGRLLETELQKLMLARGNEEFAFRVLDPAEVPKNRVRPYRTLIVALAIIAGGMLSLLVIFVRHAVRSRKNLSPQ